MVKLTQRDGGNVSLLKKLELLGKAGGMLRKQLKIREAVKTFFKLVTATP